MRSAQQGCVTTTPWASCFHVGRVFWTFPTSLKPSPCLSLKRDLTVPILATARGPRWSRTLPTPPWAGTWAAQAPEGPCRPPAAGAAHRPSSLLPSPSAVTRNVINSSSSLVFHLTESCCDQGRAQNQPAGSGLSLCRGWTGRLREQGAQGRRRHPLPFLPCTTRLPRFPSTLFL